MTTDRAKRYAANPNQPGAFRLYNCYTREYLSVREPLATSWKRLSRITKGRRNHAANWLRLCVQPLKCGDDGLLTPDSAAFASKRFEELHAD